MWRNLAVAIVLVALCALSVFAEPPPALVQYIMQFGLVHNGLCDFHEQKNIRCLIYSDSEHDVVYLVFLDVTKKGLQTSHVYAIKDDKETLIWIRDDLSV